MSILSEEESHRGEILRKNKVAMISMVGEMTKLRIMIDDCFGFFVERNSMQFSCFFDFKGDGISQDIFSF